MVWLLLLLATTMTSSLHLPDSVKLPGPAAKEEMGDLAQLKINTLAAWIYYKGIIPGRIPGNMFENLKRQLMARHKYAPVDELLLSRGQEEMLSDSSTNRSKHQSSLHSEETCSDCALVKLRKQSDRRRSHGIQRVEPNVAHQSINNALPMRSKSFRDTVSRCNNNQQQQRGQRDCDGTMFEEPIRNLLVPMAPKLARKKFLVLDLPISSNESPDPMFAPHLPKCYLIMINEME
ncbi:unnamed protein product [Notodromas monacha]|uniref:Myostatin n=1 Tax=Notodromas monacha TaxID=399045 RepID=A0A7R9BR15_9CRUS|nr:unnamed protein product [Notodromas monacha]CAG0920069.1 unnamed protein product [Notodromas monacha]